MKQLSLGLVSAVGALTVATLVGCGDPNANGGGATTTATVVPPGQCISQTAADGSLLLPAVDANNYSLTNTVVITKSEIGPGTDLTLDWSELTIDFFKHPMEYGTDANITLALFPFLYDELIQRLETDNMGGTANVGVTLPIPPGGTVTSAKVTEMYMPYSGTALPTPEQVGDYFDPAVVPRETNSYTVTVNNGPTLKSNVKMIHYLELNPSAPTTNTIKIKNDSASITAVASVASKPAVMVPAMNPGITVDWNAMVKNAIAQDFLDGSIGKIRVLHFPLTPAELETKVLDLELSHDVEYSGEPTGVEQTKLSELKLDGTGAAFPGIDPALGGTWVLALMCRTDICGSPAPWYMARLEACSP